MNADMLLDIRTNGFAEKEVNVLKYIKDRNVVDLDKLPPASYIREMYERDDKMDEKRTGRINNKKFGITQTNNADVWWR